MSDKIFLVLNYFALQQNFYPLKKYCSWFLNFYQIIIPKISKTSSVISPLITSTEEKIHITENWLIQSNLIHPNTSNAIVMRKLCDSSSSQKDLI